MGFIFKHGKGKMKWFIWAILATIISVVANFVMPQLIGFAVDYLIGGDSSGLPSYISWLVNTVDNSNTAQTLFWCAVGVVALSAISAIFNFFARMGIAVGTGRFCKDLRNKLFKHVQYLPFKWQVENQTGDTIQRCTSDLEVVQNFISKQLLEVIRTVLLIVIALILMFSMNVTLSLISLFFVPIVFLYSFIFYRKVGKDFLAADEAEGNLTVIAQENLTGVRVVRAFGREEYELEKFQKYNDIFSNLWIKLGDTLSIFWGMGDFVTGLQIFTVILAGTVLAVNGSLSLGAFLVFVTYNQSLAWPIRSLGRTLSEMSKAGVSAGRIQEILDAPTEPEEPNAKKPNLNQDIHFENVTFGYDGQDILKNLNFTIPKGKTFGILGATGSGKSTITYLLNRLYDIEPGLGTIWYGDTKIEEIDRYYLRKNVGLILQEPFLFSKSIEENIKIATENAATHEMRMAANIAAVDQAITEFANGYDTVVGERGVTLSGGQKQRVAIARTLITKAPIMVFDDSMSALDLETDSQIREALRSNTGDATVIIISHRINTLMQADQILVLEDGEVKDIGTHSQLIHREGMYKRIYDMQSSSHETLQEKDGTEKGGV